MRLSTRISLVASLSLLAVAGLLLTREELHESALVSTMTLIMRDGSLQTWAGFVEDARGRLDDMDLLLGADKDFSRALAAGDRQAVAARFDAIVAPVLALRQEMMALLSVPPGQAITVLPALAPLSAPEAATDGLVRDRNEILLRHVIALSGASEPAAFAAFAVPARGLLHAVGEMTHSAVALSGGKTQEDARSFILESPSDESLFRAIDAEPPAEGGLSTIGHDGRDFLVARHQIVGARAGERFSLLLAWDITDYERQRKWSEALALVVLITGLTASVLLVQRTMRHALKPLGSVVQVLRTLAAGDLDAATPLMKRKDEVGELIDTVESFRAALVDQHRLAALREELGAARQIQQAMLPSGRSEGPGWAVDAAILPARDVGGDFFDYRVDAGGLLSVSIADVAGKGMTAALFIAEARSALRAAATVYDGPAACLGQANDILAHEDEEALSYLTVCQAVLDPRSGRLKVASAGHIPPFRIDAEGCARQIDLRPGRPLGLFAGVTYREAALDLQPGDRLVLFTDGFTDALDETGSPLGRDGIARVLERGIDGAQAVIDRVAATGDAALADDMTCLILTWQGVSG